MSDPDPEDPPGVSEASIQFEADSEDRWTIALSRLEEHERTSAGAMSVDEFGRRLRGEIARRRAARAQ